MIKDSGERREFETGAVRDIQEGKGRCDLLPLIEVSILMRDEILQNIGYMIEVYTINVGNLSRIDQSDLALKYLMKTLQIFSENNCEFFMGDMILDVAKHYEEGAKKYAERNWEKGIPLHCYIDSGVRHYLKYLRGDADERHDRAFVWNMLGAMWTINHKPELIDIKKVE